MNLFKRSFLYLCILFTLHFNLLSQTPQLWGMTYLGGINNAGGIFKIQGDGSSFSLVHSFGGVNACYYPFGGLTQINNTKMFGLTYQGGLNSSGTILSYDTIGNSFNKLYDFDQSTTGEYPFSNLILASNGKLYGTTESGGAIGYGTIFSYDPSNSVFTSLHTLDGTDGSRRPNGSLIEATNGKLYGLSLQNNTGAFGTIYNFDISNNTFTTLFNFNNTNGSSPYGGLLQANDGKLYGMTSGSSISNSFAGVLFSFDPTNNNYVKLFDFGGNNGKCPRGSLIQASNGKLYGLVDSGGVNNYGVIFNYDISTNTFTKLYDFDGTNGEYPVATLVQASDGKLYGTASAGGANGYGVIFSFDPVTNNYTKIFDFNNSNGAYPMGDLIELKSNFNSVHYIKEGIGANVYPNPVYNKLHINFNEKYSDVIIYLINTNGEEIINKRLKNSSLTEIDLSQFPEGIYFLRIQSTDQVVIKKIMIQR